MDLATHLRRQLPRWEQTKSAEWLEQVNARIAELERKSVKARAVAAAPQPAASEPAAPKPVKSTAKKATKAAKKRTK